MELNWEDIGRKIRDLRKSTGFKSQDDKSEDAIDANEYLQINPIAN